MKAVISVADVAAKTGKTTVAVGLRELVLCANRTPLLGPGPCASPGRLMRPGAARAEFIATSPKANKLAGLSGKELLL
jgi:hypothetical protein